jgi:hypothetical protein
MDVSILLYSTGKTLRIAFTGRDISLERPGGCEKARETNAGSDFSGVVVYVPCTCRVESLQVLSLEHN